MNTLLFVYGTLKRGCSNHAQIAAQKFVAEARTVPGHRLFDMGGYPGIALHPSDRDGVTGEVWSIDPECLARLDHFEGVHEGLYCRQSIPLLPPFAGRTIDAYVSARPVESLRALGSTWAE